MFKKRVLLVAIDEINEKIRY
ncbi:hypothetical protein [Escherichia coli]